MPLGRRAIAISGVAVALALLASGAPSSFARGPALDGARSEAVPGAVHLPPGPFLPHALIDPRVGSGQGRMLIVTTDPATMPNDGLRANLTAFPPESFDPESSFQEGVSETIGGYDAVFGIFQNSVHPPLPFFSVFSNSTDATVHLAYWTNITLLSGQSYDFELTPSNGTVWTLTVNGARFGANASLSDFDFAATTSTWLGGLSYSEIALYPGATTTPPVASASLVLAVHHTSGWYLPQQGQAMFSGSSGGAWGVEGRAQHPTLAPGAVVTGTSVAAVPNGTVLWTGGPVPVGVALEVPTGAVGSGATIARATITDTGGLPIPGAAVFFSDRLGGNFSPSSALTNSTGQVLVLFETPNVSANASDLVLATVTTFGFGGSSGRSVDLSPAEQLFVNLVAGSTDATPGGTLVLTFRVTDPSGRSVPGIYLAFSVDHGTVSPTLASTDTDGRADATVSTPSAPVVVTLRVAVAANGAWGAAILHLGSGPPPPSFWAVFGGYLVGAAVAALVIAVVAIGLARRRRGRQVLPPMDLRRDPPVSAGGAPPEPATTRTPPGSCSP